jgi:hypothetical protein
LINLFLLFFNLPMEETYEQNVSINTDNMVGSLSDCGLVIAGMCYAAAAWAGRRIHCRRSQVVQQR